MQKNIKRATGLTRTEQHLAKLADNTFLDLWSWPNVFRKPGKELCDLFVVCGDDVLIFSDKEISWTEATNVFSELAWKRWYNRAIKKSAKQILKADTYLKKNPCPIFADDKCQDPIPIELPPITQRRVHGICVVTGGESAASAYFKDLDGTFMITSLLRGEDHVDFNHPYHIPFCIGDINPDGPFIHVFNMTTLDMVMSEFDTITDFTKYLNARVNFIRSGKLCLSPSEMEMVADYLQTRDLNGEHSFSTIEEIEFREIKKDIKINFVQGEYASLVQSSEYRQQSLANRISYEWDRLIGFFTREVLNGTQFRILNTDPTIERAERALRIMAREDRLQRRALAKAIIGAREELEKQKVKRFARIAVTYDQEAGEKVAYVFLVLAGANDMEQEDYRRVRVNLLQTYCLATLYDNRDIKLCVGIATTAISDRGESEDLIVYPQQEWTSEFIEELNADRKNFEILQHPLDLKKTNTHINISMNRQQRRAMERKKAKQKRSK